MKTTIILILFFTFGQNSCCEKESDKITYVKIATGGITHYFITDDSNRNLGVMVTHCIDKYIGSTRTILGETISLEGEQAQQLFEELKTSYEQQEAAKLKDEG